MTDDEEGHEEGSEGGSEGTGAPTHKGPKDKNGRNPQCEVKTKYLRDDFYPEELSA